MVNPSVIFLKFFPKLTPSLPKKIQININFNLKKVRLFKKLKNFLSGWIHEEMVFFFLLMKLILSLRIVLPFILIEVYFFSLVFSLFLCFFIFLFCFFERNENLFFFVFVFLPLTPPPQKKTVAVLNEWINQTGTESRKFMCVYETNRPEV